MTEMQTFDMSDGATPKFAMRQFTGGEFVDFWPKFEKMLDTVPHTWRYWTKEHIYQTILCGGLQIWGAGPPPNAVLILLTSLNVYPAMKVLNVVWAGGHMPKGILDVVDAAFVSFARANECRLVSVTGRRGWHPHLKRLGYGRESDSWSKMVTNMRVN